MCKISDAQHYPVYWRLVEHEITATRVRHYRAAVRRLKTMRRLAAPDRHRAVEVDTFVAAPARTAPPQATAAARVRPSRPALTPIRKGTGSARYSESVNLTSRIGDSHFANRRRLSTLLR
jgi:hypothetical protein